MPTIQTLLDKLDRHFPWNRVEKWDTVGLHIGDKTAEVSDVYIAYEVSDTAIDEAIERGAQAIVAYHPLLFRPLSSLDYSNPTARLASRIVRVDMALICVHSALDGAPPPGALGDALAAQLGLSDVKVGAATGVGELVKIVVFVPPADLERVSQAMWDAGAGAIGERYDNCMSAISLQSVFRPLAGANPFEGEVGELSQVPAERLEMLAPADKWRAVIASMRAAHPYEEVAYDVTSLLNTDAAHSYGPLRVGQVKRQSLDGWLETVRQKLNPPSIRVVVPPGFSEVETVACSPGSGASFIDKLVPGTTFVCADIKHHDALQARARGVALIDVTHAATETATVPLMADALENLDGLQVHRERKAHNPFEQWPRV